MFAKSGILDMQNADTLHELIESKPILKVGGVYDAMSAKLVESMVLTQFGLGVLQFLQHMHCQMQVF